jgi:dienelactone hydrolase
MPLETVVDARVRELCYRYDRDAPLEPEDDRVLGEERGVRTTHFAISSTHGQRVAGLIWAPLSRGANAYPTLLLQHGAGSRKEDDYIRITATRWAQRGATCIAIDAHEHGERFHSQERQQAVWARPWTRRDHAVQMCVDLQRTVDYLEARGDVDLARLGYLGFSMGTINGVAFVALDARVKRAAFAIGGASLLRLWPQPEDAQARADLETVAGMVDPVHFAPLIAPRPVLLVNGLRDEVIPPECGQALFDALGEPKQIVWFDGGHTDMSGRELRAIWAFLSGES